MAEPVHKRPLWWSLLWQRCPRCRSGKLFCSLIEMHDTCPVCDLKWEREPGYFVGAMYFSYPMAIVLLVSFLFLFQFILPDWNPYLIGVFAVLTFLPFSPIVFRYSRTIWVHFDRWAWPDEPQDGQG